MASDPDYVGIINQSRLELEAAGNPSYVVVVLGHDGESHLAPMVFATAARPSTTPPASAAPRLRPASKSSS